MTITCMWRFASILLLLVMSLLGTHLPAYAHQRQHDLEDADAASLASSAAPRNAPAPPPCHSSHDCSLCVQFHAPLASIPISATLISLGLWTPFVSQLHTGLPPQFVAARIHCRGPPVA